MIRRSPTQHPDHESSSAILPSEVRMPEELLHRSVTIVHSCLHQRKELDSGRESHRESDDHDDVVCRR